MTQLNIDLICSRIFDLLRVRAARSRNGVAQVDLAEVVNILHSRYPTGERATVGECHEAIRLLRLRRLIVGSGGRYRVVQQAHSTGEPCPPVPT